MGQYDLDNLRLHLHSAVDAKRFEHSVGVSYTAAALAMVYDSSSDFIHKALVAGLLHDNAKCLSDSDLYLYSQKAGIDITESEKNTPFLLHGKLGAYYARKDYGIEDEDILNAITWHTTGRPGMSLLEKIIFTADYIEPGRTKQKNLCELRKLAFCDLDRCVYRISDDTLEYLSAKSQSIDSMTVRTRDFYKKYIRG